MFDSYKWGRMLLVAVTGGALRADESALENLFRAPPADATRPNVSLTLEPGRSDTEWVFRQLERVRDLGAGGVLLTVPTADETVWETLARTADRARMLGLEVGVRDFCLCAAEASAIPRAQKLVWSSALVTNQTALATNALSLAGPPLGSYQALACLAVPEGRADIQPHQIVDLAQGQVSTGGLWRIYRFGHEDTVPPVLDGFDGTALFRHVNQWLFACQGRLKQTYGSTLLWYQLPGPASSDVVWPRDLPALSLKRSGLGLIRQLPALAGAAVGGEATAAYVRRQVAQTVCEAWRERFGKNVNELVHEAGLEAGIRIDEVPVAPEEVAAYFRRPTLPQARNAVQREANVRAAGGARVMGRRYVIGSLDVASVLPSPDAALMSFPWKPEINRLLAEGATRILLESGGRVPGEDVAFRQLREGCRYAQRCQILLQQGEAVADTLVWSTKLPALLRSYGCDFANGVMLETAAVSDQRIRFDSERTYGTLAVTSEVLRDKPAERLVCQMAARGIRVWLVTSGEADEEAVFARVLEKAGALAGVVRDEGAAGLPTPDFQWRSDVAGLELRFVHRRSVGHEVYFVVNDSAASGPVNCVFRDTGSGVPTRWNPADGEAGLVVQDAARAADGRVTTSLFLAPHDACFVVFDR